MQVYNREIVRLWHQVTPQPLEREAVSRYKAHLFLHAGVPHWLESGEENPSICPTDSWEASGEEFEKVDIVNMA